MCWMEERLGRSMLRRMGIGRASRFSNALGGLRDRKAACALDVDIVVGRGGRRRSRISGGGRGPSCDWA